MDMAITKVLTFLIIWYFFSLRKNAGIFHRYDAKSCLDLWCAYWSYFYLKNFLAVAPKVTEVPVFIATHTMHSFLGELTVNDIICDTPKHVYSKRVGFHKWIVCAMLKGQMFHHACMELQECVKYCSGSQVFIKRVMLCWNIQIQWLWFK